MDRLFRNLLVLLAPVAAFAATSDADVAHAKDALAKMPLRFEANQGQWSGGVDYAAHANGYQLLLSGAGATFDFGKSQSIRLSLEGGNPSARGEGAGAMALRTNYFIGKRDQWHTGVSNFARVRYAQVYQGIDLVYYGNQKQVEYDFVLRPGADPSAIRMKFDGAAKVSISAEGDLLLDTPNGQVTQKRPVIYQDDAARRQVAGRYVMLSANTVGLRLQNYDRSKGLVIDPILLLASYIGGSLLDQVTAVQLDKTGAHLYFCGYTFTSDLPATYNGYQTSNAGLTDMFLGVIDTQLYQLQYLSYLGGTSLDQALALAVDTNGIAWMTGTTTSTDFPIVGNAIQTTGAATEVSGFVVGLDPTQGTNGLIFSTYLGGTTGNTTGYALTLDKSGYIYVVGTTAATDFPITASAYANVVFGSQDAFLAVINPNDPNAVPVYSTYYGAEDLDYGVGVGLAPDGKVYVVVNTNGQQLPLAGYSYSPTNFGFQDVGVALFDITQQTTASLVYATYVGGSQIDAAKAAVMDSKGNLLITGYTLSPDFPTTSDATQRNYSGNGDAFVLAVNAETGPFLLYSTFLGGSDGEVGYGIASDSAGLIYVTGYTMSADFPVTSNAVQAAWGNGINTFYSIIKRGVSGRAALQQSTYLGGENSSVGQAVVVDSLGIAYLGGWVENVLQYLTANAFQGAYGGGYSDGFVIAIIN